MHISQNYSQNNLTVTCEINKAQRSYLKALTSLSSDLPGILAALWPPHHYLLQDLFDGGSGGALRAPDTRHT